jgi:adenosylcobinamide kinase/adenosylcobinamide-phosphate guanylyltransferase
MLILVTGGSRSGKSGYALSLAERGQGPRVFLATAQAFDDEMARRITAHQEARHAGWGLVEEPLRVPEALGGALGEARTVLVDCVTIWMSNLLLADEGFGEGQAAAAAGKLIAAARVGSRTVIVVTNEVGSGIVPENHLARRFRDCAGRANQLIAQAADEVYLLVSGIALKIKPKEEGHGNT